MFQERKERIPKEEVFKTWVAPSGVLGYVWPDKEKMGEKAFFAFTEFLKNAGIPPAGSQWQERAEGRDAAAQEFEKHTGLSIHDFVHYLSEENGKQDKKESVQHKKIVGEKASKWLPDAKTAALLGLMALGGGAVVGKDVSVREELKGKSFVADVNGGPNVLIENADRISLQEAGIIVDDAIDLSKYEEWKKHTDVGTSNNEDFVGPPAPKK